MPNADIFTTVSAGLPKMDRITQKADPYLVVTVDGVRAAYASLSRG